MNILCAGGLAAAVAAAFLVAVDDSGVTAPSASEAASAAAQRVAETVGARLPCCDREAVRLARLVLELLPRKRRVPGKGQAPTMAGKPQSPPPEQRACAGPSSEGSGSDNDEEAILEAERAERRAHYQRAVQSHGLPGSLSSTSAAENRLGGWTDVVSKPRLPPTKAPVPTPSLAAASSAMPNQRSSGEVLTDKQRKNRRKAEKAKEESARREAERKERLQETIRIRANG